MTETMGTVRRDASLADNALLPGAAHLLLLTLLGGPHRLRAWLCCIPCLLRAGAGRLLQAAL